jgi:hypothetical protein
VNGFAFVAFTEKLANRALAALFLQQHPMNFTSYLHVYRFHPTRGQCRARAEALLSEQMLLIG